MLRKNREQSLSDSDRVPIYKTAECLGEVCSFFSGADCNSRLELLEATGQSAEVDRGPHKEDCSYAAYGQVCMGGEEQVVVRLHIESPNGQGSAMEQIARAGRLEDQRIVLNTPPESIKF